MPSAPTPVEVTASPTASAPTPDEAGADEAASSTDQGLNDGVLAAIALAERDTGGTVYEIDHESDRGDAYWEIGLMVGDDEVELRITLDGTEVLDSRSDGALSSDDRAGLRAAQVGIAEAITTALAEVGGVVDEVELEGRDGAYSWEASIDVGGTGRTTVHVDAVSGEIVPAGR